MGCLVNDENTNKQINNSWPKSTTSSTHIFCLPHILDLKFYHDVAVSPKERRFFLDGFPDAFSE